MEKGENACTYLIRIVMEKIRRGCVIPFAFTCGSAGGCSDYIVVVRLCKIILYTPIPTSCAFKAVFNFLPAFIFCFYFNFTNWPVKYDVRSSDRPGGFFLIIAYNDYESIESKAVFKLVSSVNLLFS